MSYNMLNNFNSAQQQAYQQQLLAQHQHQQQQALSQNGQDPGHQQPQPGQAPFNQGAWSQMQHQNFRPNAQGQQQTLIPGQGGDQINEILRNQYNRQYASQMQQNSQMHLQQPFGDPAQQAPQASSVYQQQQQQQQQQQLMNRMMSAPFNQQRTGMGQNPNVHPTTAEQMRQLEMMKNASHAQGQAVQQHMLANSLFPGNPSTGEDRRPSPHPPNMQLTQAMNTQPQNHNGQHQPGMPQGIAQRRVEPAQLKASFEKLREMLQTKSAQLQNLNNNRSGINEVVFHQQHKALTAELDHLKLQFGKVASLVQAQAGGAVLGGQSQPSLTNNSAWNTQLPFGAKFQPANGGNNGGVPGHQPATAAGQPQQQAQLGRTNPPYPNNMPPGQYPFMNNNTNNNTPNDNASRLNNASQNISQQPPQSALPLPQPLEKARFDTSLRHFLSVEGRGLDQRPLPSLEGKAVDLHALHTTVMNRGGAAKITEDDAWSLVGGAIGFVQFPGNGTTEPPRSGPGMALSLQRIYGEYLAAFDSLYINNQMDTRRKQHAAAGLAQAGGNPPQDLMQLGAGSPTPAQTAAFIVQMTKGNPQFIGQIMGMVAHSAMDLRKRGTNEKAIQFVELNRTNLLKFSSDQNSFKTHLIAATAAANGTNAPAPGVDLSSQGPNAGGFPAGQASNQPPFQPLAGQPRPLNGAGMPTGASVTPLAQNILANRKDQLALVVQALQKMKNEHLQRTLVGLAAIDPPPRQAEYNALLEAVHRLALEIDKKMPMYILVSNEADPRKLAGPAGMIATVQAARNMMSSNPPKHILSYEQLQRSLADLQQVNAMFNQFFSQATRAQNAPAGSSMSPPQVNPAALAGTPSMSHSSPPHSHQPPMQPSPAPTVGSLLPRNPSRMAHSPAVPGNNKKLGNPASAPTPPSNAATPTANAPTPTAVASPSAASVAKSSPKQRPKPKPKPRRNSRAAAAPPVNSPPTTAVPSPGGTKRPREEDPPIASSSRTPDNSSMLISTPTPSGLSAAATPTATGISNEPSPPKRHKSEWSSDGPSLMMSQQKQEEADAVKTEADASAFLEKMTEMVRRANNTLNNEEPMTSDINDTFDMILRGSSSYSDSFGLLDAFPSSNIATNPSDSFQGLGAAFDPISDPLANDEFGQFFDFSSFSNVTDGAGDDEAGPSTPELMASTSANPSPESEPFAETPLFMHSHPQTQTYTASPLSSSTELQAASSLGLLEQSDPLRLGTLKEIDGGESAYYQSNDWKYDSAMPALEAPWAMFNP